MAPTTIEQVREWNKAFNLPLPGKPTLDEDTIPLQANLMQEELDEFNEAFNAGDLVEALDALSDMQYILDGLYLKLGMGDIKDEAFAEVHRSNMSKLDRDGKPILRGDGKILKGPDYFKPDLVQFLHP